MKRKMSIVFIILILITLALCGCNEQSNNENEEEVKTDIEKMVGNWVVEGDPEGEYGGFYFYQDFLPAMRLVKSQVEALVLRPLTTP